MVSAATLLSVCLCTALVSTPAHSSESAASATSASSARSGSLALPPFVSVHKDRDLMGSWLQAARDRHGRDVQKAKDAYGGGTGGSRSKDTDANANSAQVDVDVDRAVLDAIRLDRHDVSGARGALPDFDDDLPKTVYVTSAETPLFTPEEVQQVVDAAEQHFRDTNDGQWTSLNSGQYPVAGFWIRDVPAVHQWFAQMTRRRLLPLLQREFPAFVGDTSLNLVVDNAYLFKYTAETGRRTDVHTDSGCLSFTIALNGKNQYQGGGTWFEGLKPKLDHNHDTNHNDDATGAVIEMDAGQVTIRPGGVRHCGYAVQSGTRYIIGGFCMHIGKVEYVRMLLAEGVELRSKQQYDRARQAWEAAIVLNPAFNGPYSHLANLYSEVLQKPDTAAAVLQYCFDHVNRDSGEIAYSLGVARLESGDYAQAEACLRQCLQSDALDSDAMMALARVRAAQNDIQGEWEWYQRIVALPSKVADDVLLAKAYCNMGVLCNYDDTKTIEDEISCYQKSLALRPTENFAARYSLGCAYATKKEFGDAIAAFRSAVDASNDEKPEERQSALSNLYRVVMTKMQLDNPNGPESREDMMKEFMELMGEDNYAELAASMQK